MYQIGVRALQNAVQMSSLLYQTLRTPKRRSHKKACLVGLVVDVFFQVYRTRKAVVTVTEM